MINHLFQTEMVAALGLIAWCGYQMRRSYLRTKNLKF